MVGTRKVHITHFVVKLHEWIVEDEYGYDENKKSFINEQ